MRKGKHSPPRPRRFVRPTLGENTNNGGSRQSSQTTTDLVGEFHGQMVDRSMSVLPNVFTEVFSMQKAQKDELHKNQSLLENLMEQITKGELKKDELQQEVRCVTNKIFQQEETTKDSNKTIRALDSDIRMLVVRLNDKQSDVNRREESIKAHIRKLEQYREKSQSYSDKRKEYEKRTSDVYKQLQEVRQDVNMLREQEVAISIDVDKKRRLLSGQMETDIRADIESIQARLLYTNSDTLTMNNQITEEEGKQKKLKQTLLVLQKRNAAQITKLKRQVKEVQLRNRQRQTQVNLMRDKVAEATRQLEQ